MSSTVLYMSMSLDGFIAGPNAGPGNGLGDNGERLHEWLLEGADAGGGGVPALVSGGVNGRVIAESMATGAVVAGRGTFEPAGGWNGDHHAGVPIFILSRHEPAAQFAQMPLVTYLDDVTTAMAQAKDAAGDRNVLVHGAGTAQLALAADVLDEIEVHLIPVLLGQGRRLFDNLSLDHIELERRSIRPWQLRPAATRWGPRLLPCRSRPTARAWPRRWATIWCSRSRGGRRRSTSRLTGKAQASS